MLYDLLALLDNPALLAVVLATGAAIGIAVERFVESQNKAESKAYWRGRRQGTGNGWKSGANSKSRGWTPKVAPEKPSFDAADQLRIVMGADFTARPLLNNPERRVLTSLDRILAEEVPEWRAMCQVSLGEILASKQEEASAQ